MDNSEATFDRVRTLISETCAVDPGSISRNARLRGYGIDSVRVMELVLSIEEDFNILLEREQLEEISTVGELAEHIHSLQAEHN